VFAARTKPAAPQGLTAGPGRKRPATT